jgi:hypothetical protein
MDATSGKIEEAGVTLAPGWVAYENYDHVELSAPGIAPCPYDPKREQLFPSGLAFDLEEPHTPDHIAEQLVAALAVGALHEGIEWVHINGDRLAEPHPADEHEESGGLWDWLMSEMVPIVQEYRKRYPLERDQT